MPDSTHPDIVRGLLIAIAGSALLWAGIANIVVMALK
jgi:hypothetical protein